MKGDLEGLKLALLIKPALDIGQARIIPAVAELLVKDFQKHPQDGIAPTALRQKNR